MELFGKLKSFNDKTNVLEFELSFIDEFVLQEIETAIEEGKFYPIVVKSGKSKEPPKNKHYRKWFIDLTTIIKHFKREAGEPAVATFKEKNALHTAIKNRLLPVQRIKIGTREEILPPSLTTTPIDKLRQAVIDMEELYSDLGVEFEYRYEKEDD